MGDLSLRQSQLFKEKKARDDRRRGHGARKARLMDQYGSGDKDHNPTSLGSPVIRRKGPIARAMEGDVKNGGHRVTPMELMDLELLSEMAGTTGNEGPEQWGKDLMKRHLIKKDATGFSHAAELPYTNYVSQTKLVQNANDARSVQMKHTSDLEDAYECLSQLHDGEKKRGGIGILTLARRRLVGDRERLKLLLMRWAQEVNPTIQPDSCNKSYLMHYLEMQFRFTFLSTKKTQLRC